MALAAGLFLVWAGPAEARIELYLTQKHISEYESISVSYSGLPGSGGDWLTIVPVGTPSNQYGEWQYTSGGRSGMATFKGLAQGQYEVRAYLNWPRGGYNIAAKKTFWVSGGRPSAPPSTTYRGRIKLATGRGVYHPYQPILVTYSGLPGSTGDWLTIVPVGTPADRYGQWQYTEGRTSGSMTFDGLASGKYEVRVYLDWPRGGYNIADRAYFKIR
jgi:hypothetical protein